MPKIIVREYDNSSAASTMSTSFAVVVPGFAVRNIDGVFDQNGVYVCKSQKDFVNNVGLTDRSNTLVETAEAAVVSSFANAVGESAKYGKVTEQAFYRTYWDELYTVEYSTTEVEGYLSQKIELDSEGNYIRLDNSENIPANSKSRKFTKANGDSVVAEYILGGSYVRIKAEDVGADATTATQVGNQMAYELLGLGYEVLYKKIESLDELSTEEFWAPLKDKSMYKFRYLTTGGYFKASAMTRIVDVAAFNNNIALNDAQTIDDESGRGDIIALCDVDETGVTGSLSSPVEIAKQISININKINFKDEIEGGKYAAIFAPQITYVFDSERSKNFNGNSTFPMSFHYLVCAALSTSKFAEWYAVAGYNRGISAANFVISKPSIAFGERLINTLAPRIQNSTYGIKRACNFLLSERDSYYIWGNRTAAALLTADQDEADLHFRHYLNIRQLCCTIKQYAREVCRGLTFDPNSDTLWLAFVNSMTKLLEKMKSDNGVKAYEISKVTTDTKGLIKAKIRIVPIEAVEDFDIGLYLEDSISGVDVSADESE